MMEAGKELDASIIKKVMKWPIFDENYIHSSYPYVTRHKEGFIVWEEENKDGRWFNSSENIADAWQVVERFLMSGHIVKVMGKTENGNMYCSIDGQHGTKAETAPLAICLSALKAVDS